MSFAQLRGRLGAAKLLLQQQKPALLASQSKLQTNAVLDLLLKTDVVLTPEERSNLAAFVGAAGFTDEDSLAILKALEPDSPSDKQTQKSKPKVVFQDAMEFIHYLTADEWAVAQQSLDAAVRVFIQVLVQRLRCLHADEYTLKRVAATAICHSSVDNLASAPTIASSVQKQVKEQYHKAQRKFTNSKHKPTEPVPDTPVVLLHPVQLQRMFPDYAASIKRLCVDDWCPPPQSVAANRVFIVDSLMTCRGGSTNNLVTTMAPSAGLMTSPSAGMMLQCLMQQLATQMGGRGRGTRDEEPCEIRLERGVGTGASRQKRSLKDFLDGSSQFERDGHPESWKRSSTLALTGAALDRGSAAGAAVAPAAPAAAAVAAGGIETVAADASPPVAAHTRGQVLMQAYLDREKCNRHAPKKPKAQAAPKAPKAKAAPKTATKAAPKDDMSLPVATKKNRKNRVEHESTRNQYLARGPDGSKQFPYGKGAAYADAAKAKIAAQKWIKSQA